jgi:tetratricopeptide (TPR) repeat protein
MEATNNKKEIIVLRIYSILILTYSVFDIITGILPKFFAIAIKPNTAFVNYFFTVTGIALYSTPINIIVGYGLLRRRFWARYAAIATMLTFFVYIFSQYLYLGKFSFYRNSVYIQFFFVVLTLFFFTRKRVKVLFGEFPPFKFISWHGLLVVIIILFSFYSIFFSIFMKIKFNLPLSLYAAKPRVTILKKSNLSETPEKYLNFEILNASLLIPKEFVIRGLFNEGENHRWRVVFQNRGKEIRGIINLTNELPYGDDEYFRKLLGHISKFDLEKFMLTNNWNPGVAMIRSHRQKGKMGDLIDFKEIHMNGIRGFWQRRQTSEFFCGEFTLYKTEGDQFIGGSYLLIKKYFNENDIIATLSSIEFLKPEDPGQARSHYENGLRLFKQGDILRAQIEFANAYTLSPENPDTIFMFAKSIFLKETENHNYVKDLLNHVLKIKPNYKEAQKLLKEIESKLPKGVKSN